jgi:hypothetical protein
MKGTGIVDNDGRYQPGGPLVSSDTGGTMRWYYLALVEKNSEEHRMLFNQTLIVL